MKTKKLGMLVMAAMFIIVLLQINSTSNAGTITGTDHDFSGNYGGGEVCIVCHTPHNAVGGKLWNHQTTTAIFTPYSSDTLNAVVGQPDQISLLCLSCHDGIVAIDSFGGNAGTNYMTGDHRIGTDLSKSHPIGFIYDSSLATQDGTLYDPAVKNVPSLGGTIQGTMLRGNRLVCATCHEPHNRYGGPGIDDFLRITTSGSQLCLTCHNK